MIKITFNINFHISFIVIHLSITSFPIDPNGETFLGPFKGQIISFFKVSLFLIIPQIIFVEIHPLKVLSHFSVEREI